MLNLALLFVLIVEVTFFTYFDKKIYGNYFSPIAILSFPLLIIISLALSFSVSLGFKPVSSSLLFLCIIGLFFFWCGSLFWSVVIPSKVLYGIASKFQKPQIQISFKLKMILQIIAWLVIIFMLYVFIQTMRGYGGYALSGSDDFTRAYGGGGLQGHILGLAIPLLIFFISIAKKRDYFTLVTIIFLVIISLFYRVKTWLFIPIIGGVLLRLFNERKFRLKPIQIIAAIVVVVLLFLLTYSFSVKADNYDFFGKILLLLKHLMGYLFAGVLGFGEHIKEGLPIGDNPKALFMPFINFYNYLTGHEVANVVSSYHVFIDRRSLEDVNVKTFFGTILINGGYFIGVFYVLALSIVLYFIWIVASISKNYWFVILYIFYASALALGWFDFYYNQLPFLELPIYMILLISFINIKKRKAA